MMQTPAVARPCSPSCASRDAHTRDPIDIPNDTKPTPQTLRALRMKAGLTKGEAAHIVGLSGKAASWHQYELGRYSIPPEKWSAFAEVLKSGYYPSTCFASSRRGPRVSQDFQVGRMQTLASEKASVNVAGCAYVRETRAALRRSAAALAAELDIELHRAYRIESETSSPSDGELAKCVALAVSHLQLLRSTDVDQADARHLRADVLRLSSTEAARMAGLKGSRPGAIWSAIESGTRQDNKAMMRFRKAGVGLKTKMESDLAKLVRQ